MNLRLIKQRLLVHEAQRWLGFTEQGGDNRGQAVEMFQKHVDGRAVGEPWCMAVVQFWCDQVDQLVDQFFVMSLNHRHKLHKSEHCLTTWKNTPDKNHIFSPEPGAITIWQYGSTSSGHAGVVQNVAEGTEFFSIEGNTGPGRHIVREGDGIFRKLRTYEQTGDFKVKGWLRPWDDLILVA